MLNYRQIDLLMGNNIFSHNQTKDSLNEKERIEKKKKGKESKINSKLYF